MKSLLKEKSKPTGSFGSEWRQKPSRPRRRVVILELEELLPRIVPSTTDSWLGTTSDNWNTAANWSNGVPTSTSDVYISNTLPQGAQTPHIYAGQMGQKAVCATLTSYNNLLIDTNASLQITGISSILGQAGKNQ